MRRAHTLHGRAERAVQQRLTQGKLLEVGVLQPARGGLSCRLRFKTPTQPGMGHPAPPPKSGRVSNHFPENFSGDSLRNPQQGLWCGTLEGGDPGGFSPQGPPELKRSLRLRYVVSDVGL